MRPKVAPSFQRISPRAWRIIAALAALGLELVVELLRFQFPNSLTETWWIALRLLIIGGGVYAVATWAVAANRTSKQLQLYLKDTDEALERVRKNSELLLRINRRFVEGVEESEIIKEVLDLAISLANARGAAYVPFDERGQPLAAISQGELAASMMETWAEHLASPHVRTSCAECSLRHAEPAHVCPVLQTPAPLLHLGIERVMCFGLRSGTREVGVLNLFLGSESGVDTELHEFLNALIDEMAIGLEGQRLRQRELSTIQQLQMVRQKTDLRGTLQALLANLRQSMEGEYATILLHGQAAQDQLRRLEDGALKGVPSAFSSSILDAVHSSGEGILLSDVVGGSPAQIKRMGYQPLAMIAAPLRPPDGSPIGAILVAAHTQAYGRRQLEMLETIAIQVALLVQNARLIADLEYKTVLDERMRLAREIHDGLAQTLGFLKLHVAQMQHQMERGDLERVTKNLHKAYATLADAYLDVRDAIEGLRYSPQKSAFSGWLAETLGEYSTSTGIGVDIAGLEILDRLAPEVQAQLSRVIQEALSNIRKHAQASTVWLSARACATDITLEIRDNGAGFEPDSIVLATQFGLRGMRERAELIGAEFQVISRPKEGATVRLNIPAANKEIAE